VTSARQPALERTPRRDGRSLDLIQRLNQLYVAVLADCLDQLGHRTSVMPPHIRPIDQESRVAGYAATFSLAPCDRAPENRARWYEGEIAAIESLQPGDVVVASGSRQSFWGELLATATLKLGATGLVADAYTRDVAALQRMGFPTFVAGIHAADSLGRVEVIAYGVPIRCGGIEVNSGDLVLGDHDGVVVIPPEFAQEAIARAEDKVRSENEMRTALQAGMPVSQAFAKFKTL
jgi:4-hydroxy-4-methyl-2-oxoglutarate aldolase